MAALESVIVHHIFVIGKVVIDSGINHVVYRQIHPDSRVTAAGQTAKAAWAPILLWYFPVNPCHSKTHD